MYETVGGRVGACGLAPRNGCRQAIAPPVLVNAGVRIAIDETQRDFGLRAPERPPKRPAVAILESDRAGRPPGARTTLLRKIQGCPRTNRCAPRGDTMARSAVDVAGRRGVGGQDTPLSTRSGRLIQRRTEQPCRGLGIWTAEYRPNDSDAHHARRHDRRDGVGCDAADRHGGQSS